MPRLILAVLFVLLAAPAFAQEMTVDVFALPDAAPAAVVEVSEPITCDVFGGLTAATCYPIQPREAGPVAISVDVFAADAAPKLEPYVSKPGGYPLREIKWSGLPKDVPGAVHHLSTGKHLGKFDLVWLAGLTWDELASLHDDDHEGCVSPSAKLAKPIIPAPPKVTVAKPGQSYQYAQPQQNCQWYWNGFRYVKSCR